MLSNARVKYIKSLQQKKFRQQLNVFIAEGDKVVTEFLQSDYTVTEVFATIEWINSNKPLIEANSIEPIEVKDKDLKKVSNLVNPNQVLALVKLPNTEEVEEKEGWTIALDSIRDPGNMGTIIRIADWYGIEQIVCSKDCVDAYNSKVVQATMGSLSRVNIIYTDLLEFIESSQKTAYAALLDGSSLYEHQFSDSGILIIGNESNGISKEVSALVNKKVLIPRRGNAESLNAAVATAVICSEIFRK